MQSDLGLSPGQEAAAYVRMSTDHQKYSTRNQLDAIEKFIAEHELRLVQVYADEGRSGLHLKGRPALKQLLADVIESPAPFAVLVVYDVSRWGRFQDVDEGAHYEFLCKRAGIRVIYCAEPLLNEGGPLASVVKSMKRAMAAEYSRELAVKTFAGQSRIASMGFNIGGFAGYGLSRQLVDAEGRPKCVLRRGEWKSIATDRIKLIPGPPAEVAAVRLMFDLFCNERLGEHQIARRLNAAAIPSPTGKLWRKGTVHKILTSERYAGAAVYGRTVVPMGTAPKRRPKDQWVRRPGAWEAVVPPAQFEAAQELMRIRSATMSDEEMLERLRRLLKARGRLSARIINSQNATPRSRLYRFRFGSLAEAYASIGYDYGRTINNGGSRLPTRRQLLDDLKGLLERQGQLSAGIIDDEPGMYSSRTYKYRFGGLLNAYRLVGYHSPQEAQFGHGRVGGRTLPPLKDEPEA